MPCSLFTLIHGPRERERTERLLEALGELRDPTTGRVSALVFVPTEVRAEQLRAVLRDRFGGLLPAVTTFPQFMQRHYAEILGARQLVPDPDRVPLLREILRAQSLPFFDPLPDTWGRAAMALQALELVSQGTIPRPFPTAEREAFIQALAADAPGAADALRQLDAAYRATLRERGLADRDTLAVELLERWATEGYPAEEQALVIDGFAFFFTPLQQAVFSALVPAFERVIVTLAAPAEGLGAVATHRGFQRAAEALEWLRSLNQATSGEWQVVEVSAVGPAETLPAQVQERLFTDAPDRLPVPVGDGTSLRSVPDYEPRFRLLRAPNRREEARLVARLIRLQLASPASPSEGRDRGGGSLADHAIVAADVDTYAPLLQEVFSEYGLTLRPPQGEPLQRVPIVTILRKLLSGAVEGWTPSALFDVLAAHWVEFAPAPPAEDVVLAALGDSGAHRLVGSLAQPDPLPHSYTPTHPHPHTPLFPPDFTPRPFSIHRLDRWRRQARIHQNFDAGRWFAAIDRALQQHYGQDDPEREDRLADQARYRADRAQAACDLWAVAQFVKQAAPLGRLQTARTFVRHCRDLLQSLGVERRVFADRSDEPSHVRNRTAYAQFRQLLEGLEQLFGALGGSARPAHVYLEWLTRRLAEERCRLGSLPPLSSPWEGWESGGVRLLTPAEAGSIRHRYLYFVGLVEGVFPRRPRTNCLLSPLPPPAPPYEGGVRVRWPTLETLPEDRFLFQQMVGNAEAVVLTYPRLAEGQELSPSPFIEEVRAVFDFSSPPPAPPSEGGEGFPARLARALSEGFLGPLSQEEEEKLLSRSEVLRRMGELDREEGWEQLGLPAGNVATQMAAERAREERTGFSVYDGHLDEAAAAQVRAEFEQETALYSITQLDEYAQCPLKFFFGRVLGLTPMEEVDDEIAPDVRGRLVHRILQRFYADHPDLRTRDPARLGEAQNALRQVAEAEMARYDPIFSNLYWEEEKRALLSGLGREGEPTGLLRAWLEVEFDPTLDKLTEGFVPTLFEYRFGPFPRRGSQGEPLILERPEGGAVRVRGMVDRVDVDAETARFAVYDYKTGRPVSPTLVERGLSFQLPVYLLALQANGLGRPAAGAFYLLRRADEVRKAGYLGDQSALSGRSRQSDKFYPSADFTALLDWVQQNLLTIDRLIRAGQFNPSLWEEDDAGCRYCDFASICRYNATRQLNMGEVECYRPMAWGVEASAGIGE